MKRVIVVNGPNLNLLGTRQRDVYGLGTLAELEDLVVGWGAAKGIAVETFQSNHEGELIDRLHNVRTEVDGIVLNGGALTHYSYSLHDAVAAVDVPTVEVHLSNIHAREPWRRLSVTAPACVYQIFGRGLRGYRDALSHLVWRHAHPPETVRYGDEDDQVADLRLPDGNGPFPVAVLLHGGFWRDVWTRDLMDGLAVDLAGRSWATWNVEYRRLGAGGGWPETLEDVAAAIDHLEIVATRHPIDLRRVVTIGHSAGGHLALWSAARTSLSPAAPGSVPQVAPLAAVGLAPVADLASCHGAWVGDGAVEEFLGRSPADGADRYAAADPAALLPLGVRQLIVHGSADDVVPIALSEAYVGKAADAGDAVVFTELSGVDHHELIDPADAAWAAARSDLEDLV
jgi:3-dehydroquinate dehydratase type II